MTTENDSTNTEGVQIPKARLDQVISERDEARQQAQAATARYEAVQNDTAVQYAAALRDVGYSESELDQLIAAKVSGTPAQAAAATEEMKDAGLSSAAIKALEAKIAKLEKADGELDARVESKIAERDAVRAQDHAIEKFEAAHKADCPRGSELWNLVAARVHMEELRLAAAGTPRVVDPEEGLALVRKAIGATVEKAVETVGADRAQKRAAAGASTASGTARTQDRSDDEINPRARTAEIERQVAEKWRRKNAG